MCLPATIQGLQHHDSSSAACAVQLNDQDIHELMHFMDVDASGEIDFDEFCMGILDEKALLTSARLKVAFRYFDVNDDGRIDIGVCCTRTPCAASTVG